MTSAIRPRYSFVVPVHNEELVLPELHRRLAAVLDRLGEDSEVTLIDDGSTDRSWQIIEEIHLRDERFCGIQLSRNFGHQLAITAGIDLAQGDAVIVMDADLQDPPEVVLDMVKLWQEGYEIVYGVRDDRSTDTWFKRTSASWFYRLLNRLSDVDIPPNVGDFRLVDRRVAEAFREMRESSRFVRAMYSWVGFRQVGVPYRRDTRYAGTTKYPLRKMLKLAGDAVFGFSQLPLRLALRVGVLTSVLAVLCGVAAAGLKMFGAFTVPGWTSILLAVCLLGGLQIAFLGVIGQYIGRIFSETLDRPLYIVSHLLGTTAPMAPPRRAVIAGAPSLPRRLSRATAVSPR